MKVVFSWAGFSGSAARMLALLLAVSVLFQPATMAGAGKSSKAHSAEKADADAPTAKTRKGQKKTAKADAAEQAASAASTKKSAKKKKAVDDDAPARTAKSSRKAKSSASAVDDAIAPKNSGKRSTHAKAVAASDDDAPSTRRGKSKKSRKPKSRHAQASREARAAQTTAIRKAFVASSELRPMAQQLANLRTAEAYAGVAAYARNHAGDVAAAAYLALGHAYMLDKRFADAATALRQSDAAGGQLDDYAQFLGAEASHAAGNDAAAEELLHSYTDRYPDSIFDEQAPELEASVLLGLGRIADARKVLADAQGLAAEDRPGFQLVQGQVALALNETSAAERIFRGILIAHPLSGEAQQARARLAAMGVELSLSVTERKSLADAYYGGKRFSDAAEQYRLLANLPGTSEAQRNEFLAAAAMCDWKLKRLTRAAAEALADTDDEAGARRMYLLMELARDRDSETDQQQIVAQMQQRYPHSQWLAEALFSSGNMYLLKRNYPLAIQYYGSLSDRVPSAKNASLAHWKAAWLSYRLGLYADATRLIEAQIRLFPTSPETAAALYWRGRLYELNENNPARAAANYRAVVRGYPHFYYAQQARARLAYLGNTTPVADATIENFQPAPAPKPMESFPEASPHLAKARLLANAGLNDYVAREIGADPEFAASSGMAEAQIYASYGEAYHALRVAKRALPSAASMPIGSLPLAYWRILYPQPWWEMIRAESAKNHLDPYFVASLIRQESEFNPSVVSYANAYGLMQLLPSTGKALAREEGLSRFQTYQLLDPETNIRLGTRNLRQLLDKFGGVEEYVLAAYNAGDGRVVDWKSSGSYRGIDEFVESIPFTQTREYVQAILRNVEMYRSIDEYARTHPAATSR
jgi:soluble lytic murein transglycosylase